jgi:hypothetical protein
VRGVRLDSSGSKSRLCAFFTLRHECCGNRCELRACGLQQNVMCKETVREWCRMVENGRTDIHDEEESGPPATYDGLV